jgi:2',3'-cyclic-nucleotide 2'-phosphodiesterase (5'-nucleotidase family)
MKNVCRKYRAVVVILGLFVLASCSMSSYRLQEQMKYAYTTIQRDSSSNNVLDTFLQTYSIGKDTIMNKVIGITLIPLTKTQPESTMGNFMAEAQMFYAKQKDPKVVASILNYGSIRIAYLATGNITLGNMYEMMPFDNRLVIAEVPGSIVKEMCELIKQKKGWPIAGITFDVDKDNRIQNLKVNHQTVNDHLIYKIAISDFLANGGDDCEFFKKCKLHFYNVLIRDILIGYVQEHKEIRPILTQRISYE